MIYLDNHSTTQVDKKVLKKMIPFFSDKFNNPHSQVTNHNKSIITYINKARTDIAKLIGADKEEIIFTSGATESNNLAIKGLKNYILRGKNHFITLNTEHKCVLEALRKLEFEGAKITVINVDKNGLINPKEILKYINKKTLLVTIMMANNETGVIQPIKEIAKICKSKGVLFHTDAAQAIGKIKVDVKKMNIDMLSLSGHKFYAPKGIGALYIRKFPRIRLVPLIDGGGQEDSLRSGTLPVPLCIGLGEASRIAKIQMNKEAKKAKDLRNLLYIGLKKNIKNILINGDIKNRLPANLNISIPGIKSETLIKKLEKTVISSGSACTSSSIEASYVLSGMGFTKDRIDSSVRIGIGRFTSKKDIFYAIKDITNTVKKIKV